MDESHEWRDKARRVLSKPWGTNYVWKRRMWRRRLGPSLWREENIAVNCLDVRQQVTPSGVRLLARCTSFTRPQLGVALILSENRMITYSVFWFRRGILTYAAVRLLRDIRRSVDEAVAKAWRKFQNRTVVNVPEADGGSPQFITWIMFHAFYSP